MMIYTKTGDDGTTSLLFGGRVSKTDARCEAYGASDQAVSAMGMARALSQDPRVKEVLLRIQRDMFTIGAELATDKDQYETFKKNFHVVTPQMVDDLEVIIDELSSQVELPPKFIIPGASAASGALDLSRSILRTAERRIVELHENDMLVNIEIIRYVNRLADLLFMLARYEDRELSFDIVTGTRVGDE